MRVVHFIDSLAPGGTERSLADVAPGLVDRGVRLEVVVLHDGGALTDELRAAGATVTVLGGNTRREWIARARRLVQARSPDLVHTTLFESDVAGRLGARLAGIPSVSSLVSTPYGPEHLAEPGISPARLRGAQAADYVTAKLARRFRAVSGSVKEAYATRLRLKPDLIEVIPGGRNPDRLGRPSPARRQAERAKLGIDDGVAHVVAVGRQEPAKGLDVLLRAIPNVQTASRPLLVSVAGAEGRSSEELGRLTAQLGLQESVQFLGFRRDVPDLLCAADAFVMPSFREGLPGAVVEAMALEIPIVASDIAGTREALGPAAPAELFQPGDSAGLAQALTAVLAGGPIVAERVRAAHSRFDDEYHIDAVASRLIQFFEAARQPPDKRRRRTVR